MQSPEKSDLLDAVAHFLSTKVRPSVQDPALAFRVRIAAHLIQAVSREVKSEDRNDLAELARLKKVLGAEDRAVPRTVRERHELIAALNCQLAEQLEASSLDDTKLREVRDHLMQTLIDELSVNQPSFDTSLDVEAKKR